MCAASTDKTQMHVIATEGEFHIALVGRHLRKDRLRFGVGIQFDGDPVACRRVQHAPDSFQRTCQVSVDRGIGSPDAARRLHFKSRCGDQW